MTSFFKLFNKKSNNTGLKNETSMIYDVNVFQHFNNQPDLHSTLRSKGINFYRNFGNRDIINFEINDYIFSENTIKIDSRILNDITKFLVKFNSLTNGKVDLNKEIIYTVAYILHNGQYTFDGKNFVGKYKKRDDKGVQLFISENENGFSIKKESLSRDFDEVISEKNIEVTHDDYLTNIKIENSNSCLMNSFSYDSRKNVAMFQNVNLGIQINNENISIVNGTEIRRQSIEKKYDYICLNGKAVKREDVDFSNFVVTKNFYRAGDYILSKRIEEHDFPNGLSKPAHIESAYIMKDNQEKEIEGEVGNFFPLEQFKPALEGTISLDQVYKLLFIKNAVRKLIHKNN
ncbi:MAG: hypothetical protein WCR30_01835 [Clostridia bacterium]